MMASSRPLNSPMSTVALEVPISTAPMNLVLEVTVGLWAAQEVGEGGQSGSGGLQRFGRGACAGGSLLVVGHDHLGAQSDIDGLHRRAGLVARIVEPRELREEIQLGAEDDPRDLARAHLDL